MHHNAIPSPNLLVPLEEGACWALLERFRWPDGSVCPDCERVNTARRWQAHRWRCTVCGCRFHAAQGTAIEGTHLPLVAWFAAVQLLAEIPGLSSARLSHALELRQKTAWSLAQRARRLAADDPLLHRVIVEAARHDSPGARMFPGTAAAVAFRGVSSDRTHIDEFCTLLRINGWLETARKCPETMHESARAHGTKAPRDGAGKRPGPWHKSAQRWCRKAPNAERFIRISKHSIAYTSFVSATICSLRTAGFYRRWSVGFPYFRSTRKT